MKARKSQPRASTPSDASALIRFQIAAARRMLYRNGCDSWVAGHVSVRADDPSGSFWVTPLQYFDETLPKDVIRVGLDMTPREGTARASAAVAFHAAIYRARPDVNCVIHTHSDWSAMLSMIDEPLGMYNIAAIFFHGVVTRFDLSGGGDEANGDYIAKCLGHAKAMMLPNHGAILTGDSIQNATVEAMMFELSCKAHVVAKQIGGKELPLHEVLRLKESFKRFYRQFMWSTNIRRLKKSDPDLFEGVPESLVDRAAGA